MRNIEAEHASPKQESSPAKEEQLYCPNFDVITISGPSGTGKTSTGEQLAKRYGAEFIKVGDLFRQMQESPVVGFMQRELSVDEKYDVLQVEKMRQAVREGRPLILEGRLAGLLATQLLDEAWFSHFVHGTNEPRLARLIFTADARTRFKRIRNRENKDNQNRTSTLKQAAHQTRDREEQDFAQWSMIHDALKGPATHPFNPGARITKEGVYWPDEGIFADIHAEQLFPYPMYDHSISTTTKSVDEVIRCIDKKLLQDGLIEKVSPS